MFEKLFYNANITGKNDKSDAILVRGQKIVAVGRYEYCMNKARNECQKIDCGSDTIVPGFNDSHCHLIETGEALLQPELKGRSISDLLIMIKAASRKHSSEYPFIAMGLDDYQFTELSKQRGSNLISNGGLLIFHSSGHCAIADQNASRILHRNSNGAGPLVIDEPYEDPQILMILQHRKQQDIHLEKSINMGIKSYLSCGVTSLQDNTWDPEVFRYLSQMVRGIDITCWEKGENSSGLLSLDESLIIPENISARPVKFLLDGAFYNKTAWLSEPYYGTDDWYGYGPAYNEIIQRIEPFIAQKRQCAFHAGGDRAISELCTALERLLPLYPWIPELRIRIEHAQLINDADFERIRNLGIVISAQPGACCNPERDIQILGEERAEKTYPHKHILNESIPLALGSDFPYEESMDPFEGIQSVTQRSLGKSLLPAEAIRAYTEGCAFADFAEDIKGRIDEGFQADFFITSESPTGIIKEGKMAIRSVYYRGLCILEKGPVT